MNNNIELHLQSKIFPELEQGRPNWDAPHTKAVVFYIKEIVNAHKELAIDTDVLIIAAYAHDWGYAHLFKNGEAVDLSAVKNAKEQHMIIGAEKIKDFLSEDIFHYLTQTQKERIVHLVSVHDKLYALKDIDELVLMEADTLGGLDITRVKPTFDAISNEKYLQGVQNVRAVKFITAYSKNKVVELIKARMEYYEK